MKTIETNSKLRTLYLAQAVAKRSNLPIPKEENVIEIDENKFKIELELDNIDHLPVGLKKILK